MLAACSTERDTASNRALQNLSARYNYLYNARNLLNTYETQFLRDHREDYDAILPVFRLPDSTAAATDKSLTAIIKKAQAIIAEKNVSNYLDEAYLLLGKANFYQGNYFSASGYFDYIARTYGKDIKTQLQAVNWKARSEFALHDKEAVSHLADTLGMIMAKVKKDKAEPLVTLAQFAISDKKFDNAIPLLREALKNPPSSVEKIRWNYILGQLYEQQNNVQESLRHYGKVVSSNAPFDMYFNANLSKIKLESSKGESRLNQQQQILALLKDDKNEGYSDQIYFKAAESYAEKEDWKNAEKYYLLSAAAASQNSYQKGLTYVKLADIKFKNQSYLSAKLYYDSAIVALPKSYPEYGIIEKKAANLQYLSDRFKIIAFQDTAQKIATLSEEKRMVAAANYLQLVAQAEPAVAVMDVPRSNDPNDPYSAPSAQTTFYFSNPTAISTGYSDFLRKWGNRPLEDNWRLSIRTAAQTTNQVQNVGIQSTQVINLATDTTSSAVSSYLKNLPLTSRMLAASNQKIVDAYFDIGTFYQQQVNDKREATRIFELLLNRFPETNRRDAILYSLYRSYDGIDAQNTLLYKNLIIKDFPNSNYAKSILDPGYSLRENAMELAVQKDYNTVYQAYEGKDYPTVINAVNNALSKYPKNSLNAQYEYLKAIAIGRTNVVDTLLAAFTKIVNTYPGDKVIIPLVQDHISYIVAHIEEFRKRKVALVDFDTNATRFIAQEPTTTSKPITSDVSRNVADVPTTQKAATPSDSRPLIADKKPGIKTDGTFTNAPSQLYYFVVNVSDASLTLSSSRFGIGQFNRGNYPDNNFKHQLTEFGDDQLIYVGNFPDLESVKKYAETINLQLKVIMKVPTTKYRSFIVSKENFDKITSRDKINQYLTFFSNSY